MYVSMVNSDVMSAQHLTLMSRLPAVHLQASPCMHMPHLGYEGSCWSVWGGVVLCQWRFVLQRAWLDACWVSMHSCRAGTRSCVGLARHPDGGQCFISCGLPVLPLCWVREVVAVHLHAVLVFVAQPTAD